MNIPDDLALKAHPAETSRVELVETDPGQAKRDAIEAASTRTDAESVAIDSGSTAIKPASARLAAELRTA